MAVTEERRRTDRPDPDPDDLDWWTNLPALVGRLQRLLRRANRELARLEEGRRANRLLILQLVVSAIAFNVVVMALFGYLFDQRDKQRQRDIIAVRLEFQQQCEAINSNARGINRAVNAAILSIQNNDLIPPAEKAQRIASWENVRQTVPKCHF